MASLSILLGKSSSGYEGGTKARRADMNNDDLARLARIAKYIRHGYVPEQTRFLMRIIGELAAVVPGGVGAELQRRLAAEVTVENEL